MHAMHPLCRDTRGDAAVRAVIERCVGFLRDRLGTRLVGLILTGSFSRGEGTLLPVNGHFRVLGDVEFLVVLPHRRDERALRPSLAQWSREAGAVLGAPDLVVDLEFGPVDEAYLRHKALPSIFVGLRGMDIRDLRAHVQAYRKAWRDAGHVGEGNVYLRIPVYAATTEKGALEEPFESITFYFSRQAGLQQAAVGRTGAGPAERLQARVDQLASLSYEQILDQRVAFGTATGLIDRLKQLREELSLDGIVAELNSGGLIPFEQVKRSLAILTQQVMPAFK